MEENNGKAIFDSELKVISDKSNCFLITDNSAYNDIISEVLDIKSKGSKNSKDYRRLKRFDVLVVGDVKKLIVPTKNEENIRYYVHSNEVFDIIEQAHIITGHGGLHKVKENLNRKYANIPRCVILLFLKLCETCQKKKAFPKKGVVVKPLLFKEVSARCQVDLIDMQSCKDKDYKFILNYQDHLSKYSVLRPLKTKTAAEVAHNFIHIFCYLGCPAILQSDNGREFANSIINELYLMWPALKIVHGKPRHSQSQGSVERANRDVGDMIRAWMTDNNTTSWSEGLRFVQFNKNNSFHSGIRQSPFRAMFGRDTKLGLTGSVLPTEIIKSLQTEEELLKILETPITEDDEADDGDGAEIVSETDHNEADNGDGAEIANEPVLKNNKKRDFEEMTSDLQVLKDTHDRIDENQQAAYVGLEQQAKRMRLASDVKFKAIDLVMTVLIPVPDVDRSKGDPRNLIGVVMEVTNDGLYKLGTENGIISGLYSRNQIAPCSNNFLKIENVPDKEISTRSANAQSSKFGGQGFLKCSCTTKCINNRCICKKRNVSCNSRCHNSLPCCNK